MHQIREVLNYSEALEYLFSTLPMYQRVGAAAYKKDLSNTLELCSQLGNPHNQFKSVHIAGTNGKGSSSHMIAAILQSAGYKVGLYTSPHLKSFTERIRINGVEIGEKEVVDFVTNHKLLLEEVKPSFFETTVVMAFDYFARNKVDIAIIETGLGGRLDSTNVIRPLVSLITNIGLDHQHMLGDTTSKIAKEKAGIIKKSVPVVIGKRQEDVIHVFERSSIEKDAPLFFASELVSEDRIREFQLDLKGDYQKLNLPGVLQTIELLKEEEFAIDDVAIEKGLKNVVQLTGLKGRWQVIHKTPLIICDTAHNLDGIELVVSQLEAIPKNRLHIVWGMVNDKDPEALLSLLPKAATYYFCEPKVPRGMKLADLEYHASRMELKGEFVGDVNKAITTAKEVARYDDVIFIGGSTFVVAEIENL